MTSTDNEEGETPLERDAQQFRSHEEGDETRAVLLILILGELVLFGLARSSQVSSAIQMLTALVGGGILGVTYFSELRTKFRPLAQVVRGATQGAA